MTKFVKMSHNVQLVLAFLERGLLLSMGSVAMGCWVLMALRLFSDVNPNFELATHPSLHAFAACLLVISAESIFFFLRRGSPFAAPRWKRRLFFTLIPLIFFGWVTTPWRLLPLYSAKQSKESLKILSWNMLLVNRHFEEVIDLVHREQPDIIVLLEVSPLAATEIEVLRKEYPYGLWLPAWQGSGIAMLSRLPQSSFRRIFPADKWMPAIEMELDRGALRDKLSILALHTLSPSPGEGSRTLIRDAQLKDLGRWVREKEHAAMLIGDFNITPWSPPFWRLVHDGNLMDSSWYRGYFASWPTTFGVVGIPIDHALINQKIKVLHRRNLYDNSHSDHCPILVTID